MDIANIAVRLVIFTGALVLFDGIACFCAVNAPIIKRKAVFYGSWALTAAAAFVGAAAVGSRDFGRGGASTAVQAFVFTASLALCLIVILKSVGFDYFQPLSLTRLSSGLIIAGGCLIYLGSAPAIVFGKSGLFALIFQAGVVLSILIGFIWRKTQSIGSFENIDGEPLMLFQNGESGYRTFRIPSLIVLNKEVLNEHGGDFPQDVLLASAEARRNSYHDDGDIDLVAKLSADGGKSWTSLQVLFKDPDKNGKAGNPAPVFDKNTGNIHFAMTTDSGGTEVARGTLGKDLAISWENRISLEKMIPGPGKGIQLSSGRLFIPGGGSCVVSDDGGLTWKRGGEAREGECEAVELADGELMMVTRFGPDCAKYHPREYQKVSSSADGGETWFGHRDLPLKTPMCQSSLTKTSDGTVYLTHPDCFLTRANLAAGISRDGGETWIVKRLYNGPSGYSCAAADSNDSVFVLAEIGKVDYNEALVFLKIKQP